MLVPEGETVMLFRLTPALVTVKTAVAWTLPETALIVTTPTATPLASPELLTLATVVSEELHCTLEVRSLLLPSEKEPLAVNCCMPPTAVEAEPGETCRLCSVGVATLLGAGAF